MYRYNLSWLTVVELSIVFNGCTNKSFYSVPSKCSLVNIDILIRFIPIWSSFGQLPKIHHLAKPSFNTLQQTRDVTWVLTRIQPIYSRPSNLIMFTCFYNGLMVFCELRTICVGRCFSLTSSQVSCADKLANTL